MKTYVGRRWLELETSVYVEEEGKKRRPLPLRLGLCNHSPTGFEWGYGGSGPAQLALALLADHLGDDQRALELHQRFKFRLVGGLPREGWTLTSVDLQRRIDELVAEESARRSEAR